jgi:hypothetical protein
MMVTVSILLAYSSKRPIVIPLLVSLKDFVAARAHNLKERVIV